MGLWQILSYVYVLDITQSKMVYQYPQCSFWSFVSVHVAFSSQIFKKLLLINQLVLKYLATVFYEN